MEMLEWLHSSYYTILDSLAKYHAVMESQLANAERAEWKALGGPKLDAFMKWTELDAAGETDAFVDGLEPGFVPSSEYDEYAFNFRAMFPRSLRYSYIVLLFLIVESQLSLFCDILKERSSIPIRANDLKGDIITRSKTFLAQLAKLSIEKPLWDKLEDLSKVRNCIVHTNGQVELSTDKKHLRVMASKGHGLSIGFGYIDDEILIIEPIYCTEATNDVKMFFDALFNAAVGSLGEEIPF